MGGKTICVVRNVTVVYPGSRQPALEDVSFKASRGEMVLIAGPNGGGKTTLLKTVLGLIRPSRGEVRVLGVDPYREPSIRRRIGYVPQIADININAPLTLWDLVALPRLALNPSTRLVAKLSSEDVEVIERSIEKLKLEEFKDKRLSELSGGIIARALIARALALEPDIYVLDEPFESMDRESEDRAIQVLIEEKGKGKLVLLSEHHVDRLDIFDRALLIKRRLIAEGDPRDVMRIYARGVEAA